MAWLWARSSAQRQEPLERPSQRTHTNAQAFHWDGSKNHVCRKSYGFLSLHDPHVTHDLEKNISGANSRTGSDLFSSTPHTLAIESAAAASVHAHASQEAQASVTCEDCTFGSQGAKQPFVFRFQFVDITHHWT